MPKKGKGKGKKAQAGRLNWMSDEFYALTQNLVQLCEALKGTPTEPRITKQQAGMYIWQHIWPSDKKTLKKREECVKNGAVEAAVAVIGAGNPADTTPSAGLLNCLVYDEQKRDVLLTSKPNPINSLLAGLALGSTSCSAACIALMRSLIMAPDTRPRILKAIMKDWDLKHLVDCIPLCVNMPMMGGRHAATDALLVMVSLCQPPLPPAQGGTASELANMEAAHQKLIDAGVVEQLVQVLKLRHYNPAAKVAALECLSIFMRRGPVEAKVRFLNAAGTPYVVDLLGNERINFLGKAAGANALRWLMLPQRDAKDNAGVDAILNDKLGDEGGGEARPPDSFSAAPPSATLPGETKVDLPPVWTLGEETAEAIILEEALLDDEMKARVMKRVELVARCNSVRFLVRLCEGAEGPLEEIDPNNPPPPEPKGKKGKKGKKKGKKGKKKKLEPGQPECQTYAAGCLRLMSLSDNNKREIIKQGGIRFLTPLLTAKTDHARWHARQVMLNCAMLPDYTTLMQMYKVPDYVTAANVPEEHFFPSYNGKRPATTGNMSRLANASAADRATTAPANRRAIAA